MEVGGRPGAPGGPAGGAAAGGAGPGAARAEAGGRAGGGWLVWDAEGAAGLRGARGVVGAAVGALPGFKLQNEAHGLPVRLHEWEAALALERGWAESARPEASDGPGDPPGPGGGVEVPLLPRRGEPALAGLLTEPAPNPSGRSLKARVFRELHDRGYTLTGGLKFGADFLCYRGDPCTCHAEFCVKVLEAAAELAPLQLLAAARTAHAARKHYVLACPVAGSRGEGGGVGGGAESGENEDGPAFRYLTFSPEGGFEEALKKT